MPVWMHKHDDTADEHDAIWRDSSQMIRLVELVSGAVDRWPVHLILIIIRTRVTLSSGDCSRTREVELSLSNSVKKL